MNRYTTTVFVLFCLVLGTITVAKPPPNNTAIPAFAHIAGVCVGYQAIKCMERLIGKGLPSTGGHPNGVRHWRARRADWYILSDGFNYGGSERGRMVEQVTLTMDSMLDKDKWKQIPVTKWAGHRLGWMGCVFPGMAWRQALNAVGKRLPKPVCSRDKNRECRTWKSMGYQRLNEHEYYVGWEAHVYVQKGLIIRIDVSYDLGRYTAP